MSDHRGHSGQHGGTPVPTVPPPGSPLAGTEPMLLTHARPAPAPGGPRERFDDRDAGRRRSWRGRLTGWRKFALVGVLLTVLTPVLAFFAGWMLLSVPSPTALAAERKQVTIITASDGTTEVGRYVPDEGNRIPVSLADVPVHVQNAVLAAEDRSFRSNPGFDITGIVRAAWKQLTGGSGGGSTITQQYVKIVTGQDEFSLIRKFREVIIAAKITKQESKDRILEDYLNTIYFGRGAYGIQAASQAYFGKKVQQLTVSEAAVLAAAIRSPSRLDPAKNLEQARARWSFVLDGMIEQGWLTPAQAAVPYPRTVPPSQAPGVPTDDRAHIVERVLEELDRQGISREQLAVSGGRITTTINKKAQDLARDAVLTGLRGQPDNLHSSLVAIDPNTGGVIAYYGGQDGTGYDLADKAWNPGSAFKPFTMMAALERNIGPNSIYEGNSPLVIADISYANSESRDYARLTLHEAMTQSVNTTFVRLAQEVKPQSVRAAAVQAGIPEQIDGQRSMAEPDSGQPGLGITLGQYPVRTIDMAGAYATFAADGMRREPFFVRQYVDARGNVDYKHVDKAKPAFDPTDVQHNSQLARNLTATLTDVARSSKIPLEGSRQVAAKTGTHQRGETKSNSAAWTVGYTPAISAAVWVGDPANSAIKTSSGADIFGRGIPGSIWQRFMNSWLKDTPPEPFPEFKLIGPTPPPVVVPSAPRRESREPTPSVLPVPDLEQFLTTPTETSEEPKKKRRSRCSPFCDDSGSNDSSGTNDSSGSNNSSGSNDSSASNDSSGSNGDEGDQRRRDRSDRER